MKINIKTGNLHAHVVLPFFSDNVDRGKIIALTGIKNPPEADASFKSVTRIFHPEEERTIYILGLGNPENKGKHHIPFRSLAFKESKNWKKGISVICEHLDSEDIQHAVGLGFGLAGYTLGRFKTDGSASEKKEFTLHIPGGDRNHIQQGIDTSDTLKSVMALVDAPGNEKPPAVLGKWAMQSAKKYGYKAEVLDRKALEKEGLSALLAVGRGSSFPPVLIKTEYKPGGRRKKTPDLGLVGKGITFDTGGLSIKNSQNLHYMKSDMGGAAAVLGAVELAARLKLDIHVVGIVASAENAVDANSYRPGDVISSYSGHTIEVIDTDAEGRLVLADALSYIDRNYKPARIIDLATLTGNSVMALGYSAGALFTKNQEFSNRLVSAGNKVHERVWPMPLFDDFDDELHSDIADVRNFSGKPVAGAITAAKFLEYFVKQHPCWAHLDIAGVSFGDSEFSKMKSASGFGPRLLIEVMKQLIENS